MNNVYSDYETKFKKPVPMPEQIEEAVVVQVAKDHLDSNTPIPDDFNWWVALPETAFA